MLAAEFIEGFGFTLGFIAALVSLGAVLGLGYFAGLFIRASLTVWRRRKR